MNSLCNSCTSQQGCLMWALHHEREGYWAGTTPEDRHRLRRQMGIRLRVPGISDGDRRSAA